MLRRAGHIILSLWLSMLLIFGSTAKEFVHLFTGHEDTVHSTEHSEHLSFEKEHHHCTFLSFTLADYYHSPVVMVFPYIQEEYHIATSRVPFFLSERRTERVLLRGPPAISRS